MDAEPHIQSNFRGQKLTKYPTIQQQVVGWIHDNPKISDYEISKKLNEKFGFEFSSPSVKSWRENFLPELLKNIKDSVSSPAPKLHEEHTYIDYVKKYQALLEDVNAAMKDVSETRKNRIKSSDGKTTYIDQQLERTYQDYIKIKTDLYEKLLKYVPKDSPWKIAEEVIRECSIGAVLALSDLLEDPKYDHRIARLKEEFTKIEVKLRDKYFISL